MLCVFTIELQNNIELPYYRPLQTLDTFSALVTQAKERKIRGFLLSGIPTPT